MERICYFELVLMVRLNGKNCWENGVRVNIVRVLFVIYYLLLMVNMYLFIIRVVILVVLILMVS